VVFLFRNDLKELDFLDRVVGLIDNTDHATSYDDGLSGTLKT
jgi:hypothetical protein